MKVLDFVSSRLSLVFIVDLTRKSKHPPGCFRSWNRALELRVLIVQSFLRQTVSLDCRERNRLGHPRHHNPQWLFSSGNLGNTLVFLQFRRRCDTPHRIRLTVRWRPSCLPLNKDKQNCRVISWFRSSRFVDFGGNIEVFHVLPPLFFFRQESPK